MKTYTEFEKCLILDGIYIPKDPANKDYKEALKEAKEGRAVFIEQEDKNEIAWSNVRLLRDKLLKDSDWAVLQDATPKPNKETWLTYRQALRDITKSFQFAEQVVWPTKPE